jgi:hypothetical protein
MPKAEALSLADAIRASIPTVQRRGVRWWESLPADVLAELDAVREDFHAGRLPNNKSAVARAVVEHLHARGLSDVKQQGVLAWLAERA